MELLLQMNHETMWFFESEKCLGKVSVLQHQVNYLLVIQYDTCREFFCRGYHVL